jgi:hypothetical protein
MLQISMFYIPSSPLPVHSSLLSFFLLSLLFYFGRYGLTQLMKMCEHDFALCIDEENVISLYIAVCTLHSPHSLSYSLLLPLPPHSPLLTPLLLSLLTLLALFSRSSHLTCSSHLLLSHSPLHNSTFSYTLTQV